MNDPRLRALAERAEMREQPPARIDWAQVAAEMGAEPPADYRELVDRFGVGSFDHYFDLYGPGDPHYPLGDGYDWDEYFKDDWRLQPELAPQRAGASEATAVRWGGTEDAHIVFWLVEPDRDPAEWLIGLQGHDGIECEFFELTTVAFLLAYANGTLESALLRPWDPAESFAYRRYEEIRNS
ncbi:hypothetical protein [Glycomyces sp. NPDC021274]|uniref:hypothetical protein n=1 Tax=Glycomyces sp. NPDC021274 TaxID=3155120 RepID=UPI0034068760